MTKRRTLQPNHLFKPSFISFTILVVFLSACGEGARTPQSNGDASQPTIRTPLNDTGVTYSIDNITASISFTGTAQLEATSTTLEDWGVYTIERPVIFNTAGTEDNFSSSWDRLNVTGTNFEPLNTTGSSALYQSEQDASHGKDSVAIFNDVDGKAGFQFSKLDRVSGVELDSGSVDYGCVADRITGLTWEHKTAGNGLYPLHDRSAVYSWYNTNSQTNGGDRGQANGGSCTIVTGDTNNFINAVNNSQLCGKTNWRLPTIEELRSLVDYEKMGYNEVLVDEKFFPNLAAKEHRWSSQTNPKDSSQAYGFHFYEGLVQAHTKRCTRLRQSSFLNGVVLVSGPN